MISLAVAAAGWVGVGSPGDYAASQFLPLPRHDPRPVHVHHVICGRFSQRRAPDTQVIPLCPFHHTGPDGIHTRRAWWVETFGEDTDYLPVVADMLAGEWVSPWTI